MTAPLVDARVVGLDMKDLPHDGETAGEQVLRSPWLTQGYVDNPEASEATLGRRVPAHGRYRRRLVGCSIRIVDRIKDVIKSGGEWVLSLRIEELIEQYPGVKEAAVIGIPDEKWDERPIVLVVNDSDHVSSCQEADIRVHLQGFAARGLISKYSIPEKIQFVDHLAETSAGKIDKKLPRETYAHIAQQQPPDERQTERRVRSWHDAPEIIGA